MRWINFYALRKGLKTVKRTYDIEITRAAKLRQYAANESESHGTKVSQTAILQTLLDDDKGFRQTVIPEQEAYASIKDDKGSSKAK